MTDFIAGGLDSSSPKAFVSVRFTNWRSRIAAWLTTRDGYDIASFAALAILIVLALSTFQDYAVSNDEGIQHEYGQLIIEYYRSGFTDRSLFKLDNLYLYGGLFDIVAVLSSYVLPIDAYELRHLLCALVGIGGIALVGATARMIAGARAGFFAIVALSLCGTWYGGMFNHTKGIPLATFMAGAVYFLIHAMRRLPEPRTRDVIGFGIFTGAALGIKSLSLLLVGYFGVAMLMSVPRPVAGYWKERALFLAKSALAFLPALVIAYVIMVIAWPWAALAPLNPIRGLLSFGDFHYKIPTLLFGRIYEMAEVPRYYTPTYIAIRLPLLMLGAATLAFILIAFARFPNVGHASATAQGVKFPNQRREIALIAFIASFPVLCQVVSHGPAFDGCRHFLFVFPPIAVLAGFALDRVLGALARRHRNAMIGGLAVIGALYASTVSKLIELHPYEYLYYNQLVGGLKGAAGQFVTDYWVNIMPEAVDELQDYLDRTEHAGAQSRSYRVAVCGEKLSYEEYAPASLQWTRDWATADFFIAPTHMNCDRNLSGTVIARIERMGVTIGVVKDRRALLAASARRSE